MYSSRLEFTGLWWETHNVDACDNATKIYHVDELHENEFAENSQFYAQLEVLFICLCYIIMYWI